MLKFKSKKTILIPILLTLPLLTFAERPKGDGEERDDTDAFKRTFQLPELDANVLSFLTHPDPHTVPGPAVWAPGATTNTPAPKEKPGTVANPTPATVPSPIRLFPGFHYPPKTASAELPNVVMQARPEDFDGAYGGRGTTFPNAKPGTPIPKPTKAAPPKASGKPAPGPTGTGGQIGISQPSPGSVHGSEHLPVYAKSATPDTGGPSDSPDGGGRGGGEGPDSVGDSGLLHKNPINGRALSKNIFSDADSRTALNVAQKQKLSTLAKLLGDEKAALEVMEVNTNTALKASSRIRSLAVARIAAVTAEQAGGIARLFALASESKGAGAVAGESRLAFALPGNAKVLAAGLLVVVTSANAAFAMEASPDGNNLIIQAINADPSQGLDTLIVE